jgi:hypothetical protein
MKSSINFVAFWLLIAYAISKGDGFGILISLIGFLIMMVFIEEIEENNNSQETIWQSKEVTQTHTKRSKKEQNKVV